MFDIVQRIIALNKKREQKHIVKYMAEMNTQYKYNDQSD